MQRKIRMPVSIVVQQTGGSDRNACYLGTVEPPKVNGIPVYRNDKTAPPGRRAKSGEALNVHDALEDLWNEWCGETCQEPQPDSKFVDWLIEQKGWTRAVDAVVHVIET